MNVAVHVLIFRAALPPSNRHASIIGARSSLAAILLQPCQRRTANPTRITSVLCSTNSQQCQEEQRARPARSLVGSLPSLALSADPSARLPHLLDSVSRLHSS